MEFDGDEKRDKEDQGNEGRMIRLGTSNNISSV